MPTTIFLHRPNRPNRRFVGPVVGVATTALIAAGLTAGTAPASAATLSASVSVSAGQTLGTAPDTLVGANLAIWDSLLSSSTTGGLVRDAGIKYLRYPGGSYADIFHWKTGTTDGGYVAPNSGFDQFMTMSNAAGAKPIIIVNYGSGTAQEAADWVRYANVTKGYGIKYWEIGNEVYGNGHYGSGWENDTHPDKSPSAYASNALQYISAMKAVDPSIKIGVVATTPNSWPDGVVGSGDSADWNATVFKAVGSKADFVIPHWYPGATSENDLLSKPATLKPMIAALKSDMQANGIPNGQVFITEVNGGSPRDTQPQALWAADTYLTAAESGVANLDWWNIHNGGSGSTPDSTGAIDYNDEGMISNGSGSEPAAQTPFKPYYGIQMVSKVLAAGDTLVSSASSTAKVGVHAVKRAGGGLDVLLINRDNTNSYSVNLAYSGYSPASAVTVDTLSLAPGGITSSTTGTATSQTIPPYSLVAVHLKAGSGTPGTTTPSTTPSTPSTTPSTPSTTRATAPPVTSTAGTSAPAASGSCSATFRVDGSWSGGFQASVTIQAGSAAIHSWSTAFTLPAGVTAGTPWGGNAGVNGSSVTVTNAGWNGSLSSGQSASYGFIGSGSAPTGTIPVSCSAG